MRTTVDIPDDLLTRAQEFTGLATKRAVIVTALEELVAREAGEELLRLLRDGAIDLTLEELERMRVDD